MKKTETRNPARNLVRLDVSSPVVGRRSIPSKENPFVFHALREWPFDNRTVSTEIHELATIFLSSNSNDWNSDKNTKRCKSKTKVSGRVDRGEKKKNFCFSPLSAVFTKPFWQRWRQKASGSHVVCFRVIPPFCRFLHSTFSPPVSCRPRRSSPKNRWIPRDTTALQFLLLALSRTITCSHPVPDAFSTKYGEYLAKFASFSWRTCLRKLRSVSTERQKQTVSCSNYHP